MNQESDLGELVGSPLEDDVPLLKIKAKKVRPPLTDKQREALKKGQQKRLEGVEIKRAEKVLKAHELLGKKALANQETTIEIHKLVKPAKKPVIKPESEEEEGNSACGRLGARGMPCETQPPEEEDCNSAEDEEIMFKKSTKATKSKPKPKKKKKTIIVYESSSSASESDESIDQHHIKSTHCSARPLKSQQNNSAYGNPQNNKNSIQMHNERQVTKNFFCD